MPHDFKLFPELTNRQMQIYYFESPHKQITESFSGEVVKITDGDTIHVKWEEREKPVVIRFIDTAAPERDEEGGEESRSWLEEQIMGEEVDIIINRKLRVGKWGRIIGRIIHMGQDINRMSIETGHAVPWEARRKAWF
jgi:endonuclease YncB( thermonuclease family)